MTVIEFSQFEAVELRAGTVLSAEPLEGARKPAYRLSIDFGDFGVRQSSAQLTVHYSAEELVGTQVMAVLNFPPKRIAGFESQCLVCGFPDAEGAVVLARPEFDVPNGVKLF